ncbi:MAG: glycosyltransferase [Crocinitomicaceae bacterium]|nr:glycosyltransferase [Flavobacteriales bacterium]NQZ37262.1 glycosyltransferase [Crocinitomicaceae bacterium]
MTDPLGQSQVLPYVFGLKKRGYEFHVISFEKMDRYQEHHRAIHELFKDNDVHWHPQDYQLSGGIKTTLKQVRRMHKVAKYLHELHQFDIVHCRSYMPALTGLKMKRRYGTKFIFDMRGFWADERIDGKIWSLDSPIYKRIYNYFKRKETQFLLESDYSIIGTQNGYDEMHSWETIKGKHPKVKVIPCCANLDLFDPSKIKVSDQKALRSQLGIASDNFVLGYVGSIGTWYMLSEMLDYFKCLKADNPKAIFLFVSGEKPAFIKGEAKKKGIDTESILVSSTLHSGVPLHLSLFDNAIFFIRPSYSKKAASPVKQGEIMAMGIPLICNSGVGDTDAIVLKYKAGKVISELNDESYRANFINKEMFDSQVIKDGAKDYFSLEEGLNQYEWIYKKVLE